MFSRSWAFWRLGLCFLAHGDQFWPTGSERKWRAIPALHAVVLASDPPGVCLSPFGPVPGSAPASLVWMVPALGGWLRWAHSLNEKFILAVESH